MSRRIRKLESTDSPACACAADLICQTLLTPSCLCVGRVYPHQYDDGKHARAQLTLAPSSRPSLGRPSRPLAAGSSAHIWSLRIPVNSLHAHQQRVFVCMYRCTVPLAGTPTVPIAACLPAGRHLKSLEIFMSQRASSRRI
jgi:hypothetical protein